MVTVDFSREDRMRPIFQWRQTVTLMTIAGMMTLGLTGCMSDLWTRMSALEQQMTTFATDHRVLPQQIETIQLKLQTMDQEVRSRQSRVLTEIEHFRNEDLTHFTQRLEALTQNFQNFRREMVSSTPWDQMHAEIAEVQAALVRMKRSLDQVQLQQEQVHAPVTKRASATSKPETAAVSIPKAP
jgi:chromosome segregation ATPase